MASYLQCLLEIISTHVVVADRKTMTSHLNNSICHNLYQALFSCDYPNVQHHIEQKAKFLNTDSEEGNIQKIQEAHAALAEVMVMELLSFIWSVPTGNWILHLASLQACTKYFFEHDKLTCACMIPIYLADMKQLKLSSPEIDEELCQGNWVVNKNVDVPSCAIGADHALEQVNRSMKVTGGLIGITLNHSTRTKFFPVAPELARLAEEAQNRARLSATSITHHHALSDPVHMSQEANVNLLALTIRIFTSPFTTDSCNLFNIATKVIMSDKVKEDIVGETKLVSNCLKTLSRNE